MELGFPHTRELLTRWIETGVFPAISLLVQKEGHILLEFAAGFASQETRQSVSTEHIWVVASIAKPVATTALMQMVDGGKVSLEQKVIEFLPEFHHHKVLIRHLLTHTSGIGPMEPEEEAVQSKGRVKAIADLGLLFKPGTKCSYSTPAFDLVEEIVCQLSGMDWVEYTNTYLFRPLGMTQTSYRPPQSWSDRIVTVYDQENRTDPWWNQRYLRAIGLAGGGLFSTLRDLAAFGQMFLDEGKSVLSAESCRQMITIQTPGLFNLEGMPQSWGLGWYLNQDHEIDSGYGPLSTDSFGHGGITGTWLCVDPQNKLIVVQLGNRLGITLQDSTKLQNRLLSTVFEELNRL
jgi:CubicO group peptidase (beta-lactamase class C family)